MATQYKQTQLKRVHVRDEKTTIMQIFVPLGCNRSLAVLRGSPYIGKHLGCTFCSHDKIKHPDQAIIFSNFPSLVHGDAAIHNDEHFAIESLNLAFLRYH